MTVLRRSDMTPIEEAPPTLTPDDIARLKDPGLNPRNAQLAEIAERNAQETYKAPEIEHDEAVKEFDVRYADLGSGPLLQAVYAERQKVVERAARTGERIDWHTELPRIGDEVRKRAGLPTTEEEERYKMLKEMREARGKE